MDVSNPMNPVEAGFFDPADNPYGNNVYGVDVAGGYAYVTYNGDLFVADVSDPAAPVQVGLLGTARDARNVPWWGTSPTSRTHRTGCGWWMCGPGGAGPGGTLRGRFL